MVAFKLEEGKEKKKVPCHPSGALFFFNQYLTCGYSLALLNPGRLLSLEFIMPPSSLAKQDKHVSRCYVQQRQTTAPSGTENRPRVRRTGLICHTLLLYYVGFLRGNGV